MNKYQCKKNIHICSNFEDSFFVYALKSSDEHLFKKKTHTWEMDEIYIYLFAYKVHISFVHRGLPDL